MRMLDIPRLTHLIVESPHSDLVVFPLPTFLEVSPGNIPGEAEPQAPPTLHQVRRALGLLDPVWSTLIGRGMSRLVSHWSRASQ